MWMNRVNAEGENGDRRHRKSRGLPQHARTEAQIGEEISHSV